VHYLVARLLIPGVFRPKEGEGKEKKKKKGRTEKQDAVCRFLAI